MYPCDLEYSQLRKCRKKLYLCISKALGKSASNVSTVRGNIRKKLGLAQDDDLRRALLNYKNV